MNPQTEAATRLAMETQNMNLYTFHRADGFYAIEMPPFPGKTPDEIALDCVAVNPGTLKVVNEISGKVIYDSTLDQKGAK